MVIALLLIIASSVSYIAGRARGFSDCYKMTHPEEQNKANNETVHSNPD